MINFLKIFVLILALSLSSCEGSGYDTLIKYYAKKHQISLNLAHSLVKVESDYNPRAVSHKGAIGLTQVIFRYHKDRCNLKRKENLFNPHVNLNCGFKVLKFYIRKCKGIERGLACYNAGYGGMSKGIGFSYARKVLKEAI